MMRCILPHARIDADGIFGNDSADEVVAVAPRRVYRADVTNDHGHLPTHNGSHVR